ncbi:ABC transporter substrate-binding protein [Pseudomonas sp. HLS-6]|jgi:lysine-arginine-ornithine-binding protein|uniref:ABC transporter substrate-binding protein n=1 Tax=unclassified Pseudomonas TaxID=196821 RepID=UPI000C17ABB5|nr:ABC transporter substrate-binding protein [Pseudomonas sp. HLS-6]ATR83738.1 ABC transporter substrate-binding protein [Pseudomonas sp. HLS-6]MEE3636725.1 ABC transporter substrate-binding protein [Pseudomonas sp. AL 58]
MRKFVLATVLALASTGVLAKDLSVIRFGVDPTFAPFESKNADGELVGFDIDLGNAICAQLKAKCVWVETAFDSIIPALRAKKFDGVLSAMTVNEKRKQNVAFSDRLYNSPNRLIAKKDSGLLPTVESLKGKRVGVAQGTTQEAFVKAMWAPHGVIMVSYQNQDVLYPDLVSGRIDASLTDAAVADIGFLQTPRNTGFAFAGDAVKHDELLGEGIAIGLRKDDHELIEAINGALAEMHKNGTYDTIQKKYFSFDIYN